MNTGFVSIVGRPNTGKSTLLNALCGQKVSIVADKPQTTRNRIQGVLNLPEAQVIFLDTPGIHQSDSLFNRRMMARVHEALQAPDLLYFLVDATKGFSAAGQQALDVIAHVESPAFLVLNKIDRVEDKRTLLPLIEKYSAKRPFDEYVPISARTGNGLDLLRDLTVKRLPEGPALFPPDYWTDQPERFIAAELVREKILHRTRQEVPHSVAVTIDQWQEGKKLTRISATIHVERRGQRSILIGAKGQLLKEIGTEARVEIEEILGRKVFLELFIKVSEDWRERPDFLNELDWR